MSKQFIMTALILPLMTGFLYPQTFLKPNFSLKSHETLEIKKVVADAKATVFYMSIENRIEGGTFCADKNIYMIYPDGKRSKMTASDGIPKCPDGYKFRTIGERLDFVLTFPPLKQGTEWVDLTEDCSENCFSFYGITLDNDLNKKIDEAFSKAEFLKPVESLPYFKNIIEETDKKNLGSEGLLYINIIKLEKEAGDRIQVEEWYKRFKSSGAPRLSQYIKYLNDQDIKY